MSTEYSFENRYPTFEKWLQDLYDEASGMDFPISSDRESWREYYDDQDTPIDAIIMEMSYS